jgi:hypothetical protein
MRKNSEFLSVCNRCSRRMAKVLAGKDDSQLLGKTEYQLRDRVHELGARALEVAVDERQKKGRIRGS